LAPALGAAALGAAFAAAALGAALAAAAFLGAALAAGLAAAAFLGGINRKFLIPAAIFALVFAGLISVNRVSSASEDRLLFWRMGTRAVTEKPLLGYGAESGEFIYNSLFAREKVNLESLIIDRSHNLFLDIAMWSGIPGLLVFCLWLYFSFRRLTEDKKFAVLSLLLYSFFQPLSIVHWILLIITINI